MKVNRFSQIIKNIFDFMKSPLLTMKTNTTTIQNDYINLKDKVVALMKESQGVLDAVQKECGRDAGRYQLPIEKVESDRMTLTLVGEFQSGKSTLFNYLCGGKELSPVGLGTGGMNTSACRVVASALPAGEKKDYAEVTWRSKKDIVGVLESYHIVSKDGQFKPEEFDPDKKECRDKVEQYLLEKLTLESSQNINLEKPEERAPFRHALILIHFYDAFKNRIEMDKQERINEVDRARCYASYPRMYEARYTDEVEKGGKPLDKVFTEEEVAFAFCKNLHYYVDSEGLKMGRIDVEDCPGLFANECDTEIATNCMKNTDAILFGIKGENTLSQDCVKLLVQCRESLGGDDRLFFGANVKGRTLNDWMNNVKVDCIKKIESIGFEKPEIRDYQTALALRSLEYGLNQYNALEEYTREAIEQSMESESGPTGKKLSCEEYLEKKIRKFLDTFLDQEIDEYKDENNRIKWQETLKESRVQDFIDLIQTTIPLRKANAILRHRGTKEISKLLERAKKSAENRVKELEQGVEQRRKELNEKKELLEKFQSVVSKCTDEIDDSAGKFQTELDALLKEQIKSYYGNRAEELKQKLTDSLNALVHHYNPEKDKGLIVGRIRNQIKEHMVSLLAQLRDKEVVKGILKLPSYGEEREMLRKWGKEYQEYSKSLPGFDSFEDAQEREEQQDIVEELKKLPIIIDDISGLEEINISYFNNIINPLHWLETDEDRARAKVGELLRNTSETIIDTAKQHFTQILKNGQYWRILNDYVMELKNAADHVREALNEEKKRAEADSKAAASEKQRVRGVLEPMTKMTIPDLLKQCQDLDDEILEKFGEK